MLKEKRGSEYYRQIARLGGQANMSKYGLDHFSEMGKKGGNTTKQRHGPDFYRRIGKMGGAAKKKGASTGEGISMLDLRGITTNKERQQHENGSPAP